MNDFEVFEEFWKEAVNSACRRIGTEIGPVVTKEQVNEIWRQELLDKRFYSTESNRKEKLFLDRLYEYRPSDAKKLSVIMQSGKIEAGCDLSELLAGSGTAAGGAAAAVAAAVSKIGTAAKITLTSAGTAAAVIGTAMAANKLMKARGSKVIDDLRRETDGLLAKCKTVFDENG